MEAGSGWNVRFCTGPAWEVSAKSTRPAVRTKSMFARLEANEKSERVVSRWLKDSQASEAPAGARSRSEVEEFEGFENRHSAKPSSAAARLIVGSARTIGAKKTA